MAPELDEEDEPVLLFAQVPQPFRDRSFGALLDRAPPPDDGLEILDPARHLLLIHRQEEVGLASVKKALEARREQVAADEGKLSHLHAKGGRRKATRTSRSS